MIVTRFHSEIIRLEVSVLFEFKKEGSTILVNVFVKT